MLLSLSTMDPSLMTRWGLKGNVDPRPTTSTCRPSSRKNRHLTVSESPAGSRSEGPKFFGESQRV